MPIWKKHEDPYKLLIDGKYKEAIKILKKHLKNDPENINLYIKLGDALIGDGEEGEGVRQYEQAAEFYAKRGFLLKAIALHKKILKINPNRRENHARLAELNQTFIGKAKPTAKPTPAPKAPAQKEPAPSPTPEIDTSDVCAGARIPLFSDISPQEFAELVSRLNHYRVSAGHTIVHEGERGDSMFVISEGTVAVKTKDKKGNEIELTKLGEGEFFGEVSLLKSVPRTATVVAESEVELLEITKNELDYVSKKYPGFVKIVEEFYNSRVQHTIETLKEKLRS